jgi:tRNA G18 (ribose-2'-O)-methylase SpoU
VSHDIDQADPGSDPAVPIQVNDLDDPALEPYRDLRHRNWIEASGQFVAEGPLLVQRLLASDYSARSVLLDSKYLEQYRGLIPAKTKLLVIPHSWVEQLVGFNFHRGVLACGHRKPQLPLEVLASDLQPDETWLGLFGVQDPENVGGILRTAAGLGIRTVLIGPGTADPLSRRALRVSMGNVLSLQLCRTTQIADDLQLLKSRGLYCVATCLSSQAQSLGDFRRLGPTLLLLGNEKNGLPASCLQQADCLVRINMQGGTDSLNVGVAAGIVIYHLSRSGSLSKRSPSLSNCFGQGEVV